MYLFVSKCFTAVASHSVTASAMKAREARANAEKCVDAQIPQTVILVKDIQSYSLVSSKSPDFHSFHFMYMPHMLSAPGAHPKRATDEPLLRTPPLGDRNLLADLP